MKSTTLILSDHATSGADLLVSIRHLPKGKWTEGIIEQLREAVRDGALRPGVQLPSSRALAEDLGVSRGVVLGAYDQLKAEGFLTAEHGSGTVVADIGTAQSFTAVRIVDRHRQPSNPGVPDPGLFPRKEWLRAYRSAFNDLSGADLRYGDPQGFLPLRTQLADYLGRVRGIRSSPDQILIVNGFAQGLAIIARLLARTGITAIAVEEPGSIGTRNQLQDWGLATPAVDVDEEGLDVESLRATHAQAVLVTPAHQYPTGVALSAIRRRDLLRWVSEEPNRLIIEDDYDAEYRYDHAPIGSLQAANPQQVLTGASISKTLAPALRLGWLVLPTALVESATTIKATFDLGTSVPSQAALAELLRNGSFDRHLRRTRLHYSQKRQAIVARLRNDLPDCNLSGFEAGLNICIQLNPGTDDQSIAAGLKSQGVRCEALSEYQQGKPARSGLVIDLSAIHSLELIIAAIAGDPQLSPTR